MYAFTKAYYGGSETIENNPKITKNQLESQEIRSYWLYGLISLIDTPSARVTSHDSFRNLLLVDQAMNDFLNMGRVGLNVNQSEFETSRLLLGCDLGLDSLPQLSESSNYQLGWAARKLFESTLVELDLLESNDLTRQQALLYAEKSVLPKMMQVNTKIPGGRPFGCGPSNPAIEFGYKGVLRCMRRGGEDCTGSDFRERVVEMDWVRNQRVKDNAAKRFHFLPKSYRS